MQEPAWVSERPRRARMTRQAALVDAALAAAREFRTAQDLYAGLRAKGARIGQTTVYRHLQLLAEQGAVDVIRTGTGESAYRTCSTTRHHHHLICRTCAHTEELAGDTVERWLAKAAGQAGFTDVTHVLEVQGTCSGCAARGNR